MPRAPLPGAPHQRDSEVRSRSGSEGPVPGICLVCRKGWGQWLCHMRACCQEANVAATSLLLKTAPGTSSLFLEAQGNASEDSCGEAMPSEAIQACRIRMLEV